MRLHKVAIFAVVLARGLVTARAEWVDAQPVPGLPGVPLLVAIRQGTGFEGDIWDWDGSELTRRTDSGLCFTPIVSPAGDAFVYRQIPTAYAEQSAMDEERPVPRDIYLTNLSTATMILIAIQPSDASYVTGQARYTLRSEPTWSPDGKLVAWTELPLDQAAGINPDAQAESLVLYDVAAQTTQTLIPELPAHRVVGPYPALSEVSLGPGGLIAVRVHVSPDIDSSGQDWLYFYAGTGKQLAHLEKLETVEATYEFSQLLWLSGLDAPYLSCVACTTKINPLTGTADVLNGTPELYSPLAPDKLSLYFGSDSGDESNVTWIIALNGQPVSTFDAVRIAKLPDAAIAPDGMQIAGASYSGQGTTAGVFIYQAQSQQTLKVTVNVTGLGWGPTAWRVHPNPAQ